jgi:Tol biopolymer transport system component/lysophospholipase L1-like esterase
MKARARVSLILAAVGCLALCAPAQAAAQRYHLALGDSDAFGFQSVRYHDGVPASDFAGYAEDLRTDLPTLALVNYGCPGESTVSFSTGPCPYKALGQRLHDDYTGSQLKAALAFLLSHPLRTDLVTLTLWGNDVNAFVDGCGGDFACVQAGAPAAIAKFSGRLEAILSALRIAAGPRATIVLTGPYDPNPGPLAQLTHPLYLGLDAAMRSVAARTGVRYAALFTTFDSDAALCSLTLLCRDGDAHPSDAGYRTIADLILGAAGLQGSPGARIAFTRTAVALPGDEDSDQGEIWVMNGDGTGRRQLTDNDTFDLGAVWSPDGRTIAFYSVDPLNGPHVFLIPARGGEQLPLDVAMRSRFPSWSSRGRIAFDNGGPTAGDIFTVNPDGSGLQQLTHSPADGPPERNIRPAWSPNGRKIAFVSRRNGSDDIYLMNADGSDVTQLTQAVKPVADNAPAWSPNGRTLVFQRDMGAGNTEIFRIGADGRHETRLTTHDGRDGDPDWSPDGRTIAFERDADPIADQTFQVFEMRPDGTCLRQITGGDGSENGHPGWSGGRDRRGDA